MMQKPVVVIKFGGHAMSNADLCRAFAQGLARLQQSMHLVVIHGGGPQINSLLKRLCIESHFEKGLRVTDAATMQVVEMVLCGQVNKEVVTLFQQQGAACVGISGKDAQLLQARIFDAALGFVGEVHSVRPQVLQVLLDGGYIPVVAPLAIDSDDAQGRSLNINADTAAGAIAGALAADYFVLVSDVPGVLDADKKLIPSLNRARISALTESGVICGGMIPKVDACLHALAQGCRRALILNGEVEGSLEKYLQEQAALGTVIVE